VIRLGLRLTLQGGREAAIRLILIAAAVALGSGLLLTCLAGINAIDAQNSRFAWLNSGAAATASAHSGGASGRETASSREPLWWLISGDFFGGQAIGRVDVAATGPASPVPPGIPHLPGPGRYYASPALTRLLRSTPASELGDRFPGRQVGTIGPAALPAPNSLVIIIGYTPRQLSRAPGAVRVSSIFTKSPSSCTGSTCLVGVGIDARGIDLILSVVACALLFPLLIFVATATRLSAARREERFAAMRLVGATPRQISVISAVESTVAAGAGAAAGFGLFFLLRAPIAAIPFTGAPFFTSDLSLSLADVLLVAVGVPAAAAVVARLALRRVQVSPLGVSRRVTPGRPRAYRVIPLLAGIAELSYFVAIGRPKTTDGQIQAYLPGFLLIMIGLVTSGPWLTMVGCRLMARRARRPAALIAARRLADNPRAGFRAVSGLVLALFVTTVSVAVITALFAHYGEPRGGTLADSTLVDSFENVSPTNSVAAIPGAVLTRLRSIPGVKAATVIHTDPLGIQIPAAKVGQPASFGPTPTGLVSCAQLARAPDLGRCPAGAQAAAFPADALGDMRAARIAWPAARISAERLRRLPVQAIVVTTDGRTSAVERARTALEVAYPYRSFPPTTIGEFSEQSARLILQYQQLAEVMIFTALPIAGCTLAVSVAGGLNERKRPFSLLRLTGAPLGLLRRVVALESAVPLLTVAVISTGTGFLAAQLFLRAQVGYSIRPPGAEYYVIVVAGLAASLGVIGSTLPLLGRITGPDTARNE
jgi:hypothetical protein